MSTPSPRPPVPPLPLFIHFFHLSSFRLRFPLSRPFPCHGVMAGNCCPCAARGGRWTHRCVQDERRHSREFFQPSHCFDTFVCSLNDHSRFSCIVCAVITLTSFLQFDRSRRYCRNRRNPPPPVSENKMKTRSVS